MKKKTEHVPASNILGLGVGATISASPTVAIDRNLSDRLRAFLKYVSDDDAVKPISWRSVAKHIFVAADRPDRVECPWGIIRFVATISEAMRAQRQYYIDYERAAELMLLMLDNELVDYVQEYGGWFMRSSKKCRRRFHAEFSIRVEKPLRKVDWDPMKVPLGSTRAYEEKLGLI